MPQIIPANPRESFGATFGRALGSGAGKGIQERYSQMLKDSKEQEALKAYGLQGLPPELQKIKFAEDLRGKSEIQKQLTKYQLNQQLLNEARGEQTEPPEFLESPRSEGLEDQGIAAKAATKAARPTESAKAMKPQKTDATAADFKLPRSQREVQTAALINPALARAYEKENDIAHKQYLAAKKESNQTRKFFHEQGAKYYDTLSDQAEGAAKKNRAMQRQLQLVDKIDFVDRVGSAVFGQTPYGDLLKSRNAQEFDAQSLPQLEGLRQILGGVLSDADIRLLMQKILTSAKNPEANKLIAKSLMFENDLIIAKKSIADELTQANEGYHPAGLRGQINQVYNERYGEAIANHFQELMQLRDDPDKLNDFRRQVPPGTPINDDAINMYLTIANDNLDEAKRMARNDGYDVPR